MKTLIASDLQFSEQARLSRRLESGITSRLQDQVKCFDWIVSVGVKHKCERFVVLGDIFDSRTAIPVSVIDQACRCFERSSRAFKESIALVGNHDSALRHPAVNSLQALRGLAKIVERPTVYDDLAFVPWIEDPDEYRMAVQTVVKNKHASYLFSHVMIEGAVPADVGRSMSDLKPKRWKRVFLGDVHEPVDLGHGVQYVGAPMHHHYGDAGGERGVWVLDTVSGKATFIENTMSPHFHVIRARHELRSVRKGDFVRVQVEDPAEEHELAALAGKKTEWIESNLVNDEEETAPRIAISASDSRKKILERYVKFRGVEEMPGLVPVGLDILKEVGV